MTPFFSIILPSYNVEKYLDRCVKSFLAQSFTDYEIIIVDDGSVDDSGRLSDEWEKRDHRIKVIHQENKGLSAARNVAMRICTGEYLIFVDGDDVIFRFNGGEKEEAELLTDLVASGALIHNYMRDQADIEEIFRR